MSRVALTIASATLCTELTPHTVMIDFLLIYLTRNHENKMFNMQPADKKKTIHKKRNMLKFVASLNTTLAGFFLRLFSSTIMLADRPYLKRH